MAVVVVEEGPAERDPSWSGSAQYLLDELMRKGWTKKTVARHPTIGSMWLHFINGEQHRIEGSLMSLP